MTLTVFDLDKTLINGDSYDLWHQFLLEKNIIDEKFIEENIKMGELYDKGELNMLEYLEFSVSSLKSLSLDEIDALMPEFLQSKIEPIVFKEARGWLANTEPNLIISATPEYVVKPVAKFLGAKYSMGVKLKVENNYYTSKFHEPLTFREGKIDGLKLHIKEQGLNPSKVVFYTDSINDLPLCKYADEVFCVNPDEKLEAEALKNGWEILRLG
ncbi:MAG: HAD-IB family hydrolase [Campylobacteraceae bacterium]|nr:HAD-IB family hydrolase [Campylobacteraceae bacterium]